jgi:hypothetical protein
VREESIEVHEIHEVIETPRTAHPISAPSTEPKTFRMQWPESTPPVPAPVRNRVEREVIHAARTEWRKSTARRAAESQDARPVTAESVEVRVENVTVKIEAPASPPAATPPRSSSVSPASSDGFGAYFLRRSISGF